MSAVSVRNAAHLRNASGIIGRIVPRCEIRIDQVGSLFEAWVAAKSAAARPRGAQPGRSAIDVPPANRTGVRAYFVFCAPTCWSQILNASTCAEGGSDCVCGKSLSHASYSGRPNSLIASWLSFGAIDSGTFFTAGPG